MGWGGVRQSNFLQSVNFSDSSQQPKMKKLYLSNKKWNSFHPARAAFSGAAKIFFQQGWLSLSPLEKLVHTPMMLRS